MPREPAAATELRLKIAAPGSQDDTLLRSCAPANPAAKLATTRINIPSKYAQGVSRSIENGSALTITKWAVPSQISIATAAKNIHTSPRFFFDDN